MYYWKYLLSSKQNGKEAKLVAFDELSQWLRFHNIKKKKKKKKMFPAVLVGDFTMSLKKNQNVHFKSFS